MDPRFYNNMKREDPLDQEEIWRFCAPTLVMTASRLPSAGGPCVCLRADLADSGCTEVVAAPAEMVVPAAAPRYAVWLVKKRSAWRKKRPKMAAALNAVIAPNPFTTCDPSGLHRPCVCVF